MLTQGWAYPDEEIRFQVITFLDKSKPPQPGQAPPPLSPADWVFIGNVPVRLEVRDEGGKLVNVSIPQGLSTDDQGFLEATFKVPGEEGKYTMIAYAVIKGVECSDSEEFTVSSEERILPPAPSPAPAPSPSNSTLLATLSMLALLAVAAALGVFAASRRGAARSGK